MAPTGTMRIPAYLRYDLDEHHDIVRLQARWQLPAMVRQFALCGVGAVPAGLALSRGLFRNQGLSGIVGFLGGFRGVGGRGRSRLADLLDDACAGNVVGVKSRMSDEVVITLVNTIDSARPISLRDSAEVDRTRCSPRGGRWRGESTPAIGEAS